MIPDERKKYFKMSPITGISILGGFATITIIMTNIQNESLIGVYMCGITAIAALAKTT